MSLRLKVSKVSNESLQNQIFEQIRTMILEETLKAGEPLPSTRMMSEQLGISRNTMTLAYERLEAEGYVDMRKSVGTFVALQVPGVATFTPAGEPPNVDDDGSAPCERIALRSDELKSQALVNASLRRLTADFWPGRPDPNSFPLKMWARLIANCLRSAGAALTEYRDPLGVRELRQAIVDHLRPTRGIMVDAEQVIIVGGSQGGLNLACRLLVTLGSSAFVESPCYQGAAYLFESFGAKLHPVHVDDNGIDVSKLPATQNAICYVTPSHQFPLGVTLSLDRRLELLAWATRTNSYIIEDDYDSDIRYRGAPIAALKALDRCERVIYVGTFSKSMGAGLRIGYVVMPATLFDAARHIKTLTNNGQPWLPQAALADFITNGSYDRHLRRIRHSYQARRETLLAALQKHFGGSTIVGDNAGMHLVWRMPDQLPPANVVEKIALKAGVGVYTLNSGGAVDFGVMRDSDRYLVLGFTAPSEREISIGISRLAAALRSGQSAGKAPRASL